MTRVGFIVSAYAAFLALVFWRAQVQSGFICGPPSSAQAVEMNRHTMLQISQRVIRSADLVYPSSVELQQSLERELQTQTEGWFSYWAKIQVEASSDGRVEVYLEYPPRKWPEGLDLDSRFIWEVDLSSGRILSEPAELEN